MWPCYGQVLNSNLVLKMSHCWKPNPSRCVSGDQHSLGAVSCLAAVLSPEDVTCSFVVFVI